MNYLRNIYEDLRLVSNSICGKLVSLLELLIISMIVLKLPQFHFLLLILIYFVVILIPLPLHCYMESFYTNIISKQNCICYCVFTALSQFLVIPCNKQPIVWSSHWSIAIFLIFWYIFISCLMGWAKKLLPSIITLQSFIASVGR